jgi:hypothetical protein
VRPPGDLVGAALRAERLERDVDLADGLGVEERIADDGRRRVVVLPLTTARSALRAFVRLGSDEATVTAGADIRDLRAHELPPSYRRCAHVVGRHGRSNP